MTVETKVLPLPIPSYNPPGAVLTVPYWEDIVVGVVLTAVAAPEFLLCSHIQTDVNQLCNLFLIYNNFPLYSENRLGRV